MLKSDKNFLSLICLQDEEILLDLCSLSELNPYLERFLNLASNPNVDINHQMPRSRNTPIVQICHDNTKNLEVALKILLDRKDIDLSLVNNEGNNALTQLCRHHKEDTLKECVELLIESGINVEHQNRKKRNALSLVSEFYTGKHKQDIICLLVDHMKNLGDVSASVQMLRNRGFNTEADILEKMVKSRQKIENTPVPSSVILKSV